MHVRLSFLRCGRSSRGLTLSHSDYSAQVVINTILSQAFPEDPIVGEEDATDLCARVVELVDDILAPNPPLSSSPDSSADIGSGGCEGERAEWGLGRRWGADALLKAIDRGSHAGGLRSGHASSFFFFK